MQDLVVLGISTSGKTVSALTSQDSSYIPQMGEPQSIGGRVRGTLISVCRKQMVISFHLPQYGLDFTMVAKLAGFVGRHHEPAREQMCTATKSLYLRATFQNNSVLVQDNAPPHTARATGDFLENQAVKVMDWSFKSSDLNPMEHFWDPMAFISVACIIPTLMQHNCRWLCSRFGLP